MASNTNESELFIQKQLKEVYEGRLQKIDDELGADGTEVKLKVMQWRIRDLEEQNDMFRQTVDNFVEKLASRAQSEKLQNTQIEKYKNDITNLLELIRRIREDNTWDANGLIFHEVTQEDIFGTEDMSSGVRDSQLSAAVGISVETTLSTHQNQSNKDTCESLAAEVAEKHNEIIALHHKIQHLTEICHKAGIMVHFKDAIKQMREDQKASEFKHVFCSPDHESEVNNSQPEEQSLFNVPQQIDNEPNDNLQVQSPVNKSDYRLEQVHTPGEPQHSFSWKYHSTPKESGTSCSTKKLCYSGNTNATKHQCAHSRSLCLEHIALSHIADVTDQSSVAETRL